MSSSPTQPGARRSSTLRYVPASAEPSETRASRPSPVAAVLRLQNHYKARDLVRRGLCLLNAGQADAAERLLRDAVAIAPKEASAAACLVWAYGEARSASEPPAAAAPPAVSTDRSPRIRLAWLLNEQGRREEALQTLRDGLAETPHDAELQYQLGLLLADGAIYDEAELRFTQAVVIDRTRVEAWINLAMCQGACGRPADAVKSLEKAQRLHRHDPRIALLLTQAFRAARDRGAMIRLSPMLPPEDGVAEAAAVEELSRIVERDPEFVDALLSLPDTETPQPLYTLLLETLRQALERRPELADLHYHCGRVLERTGRLEDAIREGERAVALDVRHARALIDLARWYRRARRHADAVGSLERVLQQGFEYPDVYRSLGDLYREEGKVEKARSAYRRALMLKPDYVEVQGELDLLASEPVGGTPHDT